MFHGEKFGEETVPTHFKNIGGDLRQFHIDYAFVSKAFDIEAVTIASYAEWSAFSDHTPLSVDLRLSLG